MEDRITSVSLIGKGRAIEIGKMCIEKSYEWEM